MVPKRVNAGLGPEVEIHEGGGVSPDPQVKLGAEIDPRGPGDLEAEGNGDRGVKVGRGDHGQDVGIGGDEKREGGQKSHAEGRVSPVPRFDDPLVFLILPAEKDPVPPEFKVYHRVSPAKIPPFR